MPRNPLSYELVGYADNNFARDTEDQKSVIGYFFFLNRAMVFWSSKRQRIIFILTTKIKYIALGHTAKKAV